MTSAIGATLEIAGTWFSVDEATIELNSSQVPFARAQITVPLPNAVTSANAAALVDVTARPTAHVVLDARWGTGLTLAQMGALFPTDTLATMGARWPTQNLGQVGILYGKSWDGVFPIDRTQVRRFALRTRGRTINRAAGTATFTLTSKEQDLIDYVQLTSGPMTSGPTLRDVARLAIGVACGPSEVLVVVGGLEEIPLVGRVWEPGVSAWSWVGSALASKGYRLWCDELGVWHLQSAATIYNGPASDPLDTTNNVRDVADTVSPDSDGYADAVIVTYRWTDAAGVQQVQRDIAGTGGKVLSIELTTPYPGPGEAAARLVNAQRRLRTLTVDAVANPWTYPDTGVGVVSWGGEVLLGIVSSVAWRVPDDTMSVHIIDVEVA